MLVECQTIDGMVDGGVVFARNAPRRINTQKKVEATYAIARVDSDVRCD